MHRRSKNVFSGNIIFSFTKLGCRTCHRNTGQTKITIKNTDYRLQISNITLSLHKLYKLHVDGLQLTKSSTADKHAAKCGLMVSSDVNLFDTTCDQSRRIAGYLLYTSRTCLTSLSFHDLVHTLSLMLL